MFSSKGAAPGKGPVELGSRCADWPGGIKKHNASFAEVVRWFHRFALEKFMKSLLAMAAGAVPLLATGVALAQNGNMMNGGGWDMGWMGGYGGVWGPVLLVAVVVGLVVLLMRRKSK